MDTLALLNGVRFIDTFFPSGGYAFSSGLESAVQEGAVADVAALSDYVLDVLRHGIGPSDGIGAGFGHDAVQRDDLQAMAEIDRQLDAMKLSREPRQASRQMGRQLLRSGMDHVDGSRTLTAYAREVEESRTPGHLALALGGALAVAGWSREQAIAAFLYQVAVGYLSASFKLLSVGQREGQRLLAGWIPAIHGMARDASDQTTMRSWSPVQDVYAMRHARATVRLFRS